METLLSLSPLTAAAVPVVLGLVEVVKQLGLPSKFATLAAIAIGVGISWILGSPWPAFLTQGILIGLASSGLFSGVKKQFEG